MWRILKRLDAGRTWRRCGNHGDMQLSMTCLLSYRTWNAVCDYAKARRLKPARLTAIVLESLCQSDRLHEVVGLKPLPPRMHAAVSYAPPVATVELRTAL
jgi:hypothetical protein